MDSMVNLLKTFSIHSTSITGHSRFSKLVKAILFQNNNVSLQVQAQNTDSLLSQLDQVLVKCDLFFNVSKEEEFNRIRKEFLEVWRFLLKLIVSTDSTTVQTKAFLLITAIIQRKEFSLVILGFRENKNNISTDVIEVQLEYQELLVDTFIVVIDSISLRQENLVQTIQFCAKVLSVCCFRLPSVGNRISIWLEKKKSKNEANAGIFQLHKRRSIIKIKEERIFIARMKQFLLEKVVADDSSTYSSGSNLSTPTFSQHQVELSPIPSIYVPIQLVSADAQGEIQNHAPEMTSDITRSLLKLNIRSKSDSISSKKKQKRSFKRAFFRNRSREEAEEKSSTNHRSLENEEAQLDGFVERNPDLYQWSYFSYSTHSARLENFLKSSSCECLKWLDEKETFFIAFLEGFISHVVGVCSTRNSILIPWSLVPLYDLLLDCFWPLFKSYLIWHGRADRHPDNSVGFIKSPSAANYVESLYKMLLKTNPTLMEKFIYLNLCETNLLNVSGVENSLAQMKVFFNACGKGCEQLTSVDTYYFGIRSFLSQELLQTLKNVIVHLFDCLPFFEGDFRKNLLSNLMRDFFFKLFLHWSPEIRLLFQGLLAFRFLKTDRKKLPVVTDHQLAIMFPIQHLNLSKVFLNFHRSESKGNEEDMHKQNNKSMPSAKMHGSFPVSDSLSMLTDVAVCSKIDYYVSLCAAKVDSIPKTAVGYVDDSLKSYAQILDKYYAGEHVDNTFQLSRMLLTMLQTQFSNSNFSGD